MKMGNFAEKAMVVISCSLKRTCVFPFCSLPKIGPQNVYIFPGHFLMYCINRNENGKFCRKSYGCYNFQWNTRVSDYHDTTLVRQPSQVVRPLVAPRLYCDDTANFSSKAAGLNASP
jgi:hypothetical protein